MTYRDNGSNRNPGASRDRMGGATMAMIALGVLLVVGGVIYAMSDRGDRTASNTGGTNTTQSGPATTGGGGGGAPAGSGNASRP